MDELDADTTESDTDEASLGIVAEDSGLLVLAINDKDSEEETKGVDEGQEEVCCLTNELLLCLFLINCCFPI